MTEHFPILKKGQVALSRADVNTGIVLDEQYKYATNPSQKVYTIFDNPLLVRMFNILDYRNSGFVIPC